MEVLAIASLGFIICAALICNTVALVIILRNRSSSTIKDKTIAILCVINVFQTLAYGIEMYSAVRGNISLRWCRIASLLICSFTYSSIGYFIVIAMERYVTMSYLSSDYTDHLSTILWLFVPPVFGFTFGSAPMIGWGRYGRLHKTSFYCTLDFTDTDDRSQTYFIVIFVVMLILPAGLTCGCLVHNFVQLLRRLSAPGKKKTEKKSRKSCQYGNRDETKLRLLTSEQMMLNFHLTAFVYFLSWVPYTVVCFMFYFKIDVPSWLEYTAAYLAKSATISSPIVYCFLGNQLLQWLTKKLGRPEMSSDDLNVGVLKMGLGLIVPPVAPHPDRIIDHSTIENTPGTAFLP